MWERLARLLDEHTRAEEICCALDETALTLTMILRRELGRRWCAFIATTRRDTAPHDDPQNCSP